MLLAPGTYSGSGGVTFTSGLSRNNGRSTGEDDLSLSSPKRLYGFSLLVCVGRGAAREYNPQTVRAGVLTGHTVARVSTDSGALTYLYTGRDAGASVPAGQGIAKARFDYIGAAQNGQRVHDYGTDYYVLRYATTPGGQVTVVAGRFAAPGTRDNAAMDATGLSPHVMLIRHARSHHRTLAHRSGMASRSHLRSH